MLSTKDPFETKQLEIVHEAGREDVPNMVLNVLKYLGLYWL